MTSIALTIIVILFMVYLCFGLLLFFFQHKFLYDPVREIPYTPDELGLDYEDVFFRTADRLRLHGWFIPASTKDADYTVLYCHGNGGNMAFSLDSVNLLNSLGLNCFIFDYRGYGSSQGTPTEKGTYLDVRAAYRWLTKKKGVNPLQVIIFGCSLGATIAAYLSCKVRSLALVIEGAFTSYIDIGKNFYPYMPVRWFARFKYPAIDYVGRVKCPIMIIHSRDDEIVPFKFGLRLFEAANEPKQFIELKGAHNDAFLISGEVYKKAWSKLIQCLKEGFRGKF